MNSTSKAPLLSLGPMAGVTDKAFRRICREMGLEFAFTEMISAKGLYYDDAKTKELIDVEDWDRPIGVQIFGSEPEIMAYAASKVEQLADFDVLDINMGCPAPKIVKNGDGSALMKDIKNAAKIVAQVRKASSKTLSVKFRLGWDNYSINALKFAKAIEEAGADFITIHGRTRDQMYTGKADWSVIKQVKENSSIPVIGNGDIFTPQDALNRLNKYGVDGIMIARGVQGNPWLIPNIKRTLETGEVYERKPSVEEIIEVVKRHTQYLLEYKGERSALLEMRKHGAWYTKGIKGSSSLREKMNKCESNSEFFAILDSIVDISLQSHYNTCNDFSR